MTFQDWQAANLGQVQLNPDPPNGINGQCVNLASSWSMAQGGPELRGATAYEIYQNFRDPFFEVIANTPTNQPSEGDIVFFVPNYAPIGTGYAGHIDVCVDNISSTGFRALDTDWEGHPYSEYINHSFAGVAGWFHHNKGGDMASLTNEQDVAVLYSELLGRGVDDQAKNWVGIPWPDAFNGIATSSEGQAFTNFVRDAQANYQKTKDQVEALKAELGKKNNADPSSIVITKTGWSALFDVIKSFFNKN